MRAAWSPDGKLLAFTRTQGEAQTAFVVTGAGVIHPLSDAPSEVSWPAACSAFFSYGEHWIVDDTAGTPGAPCKSSASRLRRPSAPFSASQADGLGSTTASAIPSTYACRVERGVRSVLT